MITSLANQTVGVNTPVHLFFKTFAIFKFKQWPRSSSP